jgi:O-methyltransferase
MVSNMRRFLNHPLMLRLVEVFDRRSENRNTEFGMLAQCFEFCKINEIKGDYFEFGVWRGKTFDYARTMARRYSYGPLVFRGFDSFQGLPQVPDRSHEIWSEGQFTCSRIEFEEILRKKGFQTDDYALVEGFYAQSLTPALSEQLRQKGVKASIIYVDCDLYESTRDVLAFIPPFLQQGTILCFDDFYNYRGRSDEGEQRAFKEFCAQHTEFTFSPYIHYSPLGMSFICQHNSSSRSI